MTLFKVVRCSCNACEDLDDDGDEADWGVEDDVDADLWVDDADDYLPHEEEE